MRRIGDAGGSGPGSKLTMVIFSPAPDSATDQNYTVVVISRGKGDDSWRRWECQKGSRASFEYKNLSWSPSVSSIRVGSNELPTLLVPSSKYAFQPQHHTVPSASNAQVWYVPADMATAVPAKNQFISLLSYWAVQALQGTDYRPSVRFTWTGNG